METLPDIYQCWLSKFAVSQNQSSLGLWMCLGQACLDLNASGLIFIPCCWAELSQLVKRIFLIWIKPFGCISSLSLLWDRRKNMRKIWNKKDAIYNELIRQGKFRIIDICVFAHWTVKFELTPIMREFNLISIQILNSISRLGM